MAAQRDADLEQPREGDDEVEDLEDLKDDEDAALPLAAADEEETDEASLEELLMQRAGARRAGEESEEEPDLMALTSEPEIRASEPLPTRVVPVKDAQEFVCNSCHLVKAKSQLADASRGLCRDCV